MCFVARSIDWRLFFRVCYDPSGNVFNYKLKSAYNKYISSWLGIWHSNKRDIAFSAYLSFVYSIFARHMGRRPFTHSGLFFRFALFAGRHLSLSSSLVWNRFHSSDENQKFHSTRLIHFWYKVKINVEKCFSIKMKFNRENTNKTAETMARWVFFFGTDSQLDDDVCFNVLLPCIRTGWGTPRNKTRQNLKWNDKKRNFFRGCLLKWKIASKNHTWLGSFNRTTFSRK